MPTCEHFSITNQPDVLVFGLCEEDGEASPTTREAALRLQ